MSKYGKKLGVITIEETPTETIHTNVFSRMKNNEEKEKLIKYFVKKWIISGVDWYSIENPRNSWVKGSRKNWFKYELFW